MFVTRYLRSNDRCV